MQRVGVIGLGPIGNRHARIYDEMDGAELAGVCDIDRGRADATAAALGVPAFYRVADLLDGADLTMASVATGGTEYVSDHHEQTLQALEAGLHVLCEKPFARDAAEAQQMLDKAVAAGIVHMLGTEFRFSTAQALATRAIKQGLIGEPRLVNFTMNVPLLADPSGEVPSWWSKREDGGGWLGAYASHIIDQIRTSLGEFSGVSASLSLVSDRDWTAEDSYTIHFRLKSGVDGILQSTAGAWGVPVVCSKIYGSRGTLSIEGDNVTLANPEGIKTLDVPDDLVNGPADPAPAEFMVTAYDHLHASGFDLAPYTKLCAIMRDRILGLKTSNDPAPATFADGVAGQKVLDAIRLAAAERRWVDIG